MRCFESTSDVQSHSFTQSPFVSWKNFKTWEMNVSWTWIFVLKSRRGNALHMAGQVSPAVCCMVGSQLQFFRIKLLLQKFFKAVVKVSMCSCAVLNQVFAAQLGSRAGAPLGMFTLAQQMWLPNAQKVSDSCHTKVIFWHPSSLHPWVKSHFMQSWCRAEVNPRHCFCLGPWLTLHPLRDDASNSSVICSILWCKAMERQSAKESFTPENVHF